MVQLENGYNEGKSCALLVSGPTDPLVLGRFHDRCRVILTERCKEEGYGGKGTYSVFGAGFTSGVEEIREEKHLSQPTFYTPSTPASSSRRGIVVKKVKVIPENVEWV